MTIRLSTGARNGVNNGLGLQGMFNRGHMKIFTGSQPTGPDAVETGTNCGLVTASSGALTKETRATGSISLTGGASGSINSITVGGLNIIPDGAVAFNTSLNQTASDLCDSINRNGIMEATVSAAIVTIMGRRGTGVTAAAVAGSLTTITATYVAMGSGIVGIAPVNGLILGPSVAGVIAKLSTQVWSFVGINGTVTAGWFRLYGSDDPGGATSSILYPRMDGSIATSGADLNLASINIATGSPNTIDAFQFTMPAS